MTAMSATAMTVMTDANVLPGAAYYRDAAALYRFYSSAFLYELTAEQIELLAGLVDDLAADLAEDDDSPLAQGVRQMRTYLARRGADARRDLAVDYARVFLAAGVFEGDTAVPYESVYLSKEGILMQEPRDGVVACYRAAGFAVREDLAVPEDHAGFELEFCALLCDRVAEALEAGDPSDAAVRECVGTLDAFAEAHLLSWLPLLQERVDTWAELRFYPAFMRMVIGTLHELRAANAELLAGATE